MRKIFVVTLSLALLLFSNAWAQERTVTGIVTSSEDGLGIPGASIVVKGT